MGTADAQLARGSNQEPSYLLAETLELPSDMWPFLNDRVLHVKRLPLFRGRPVIQVESSTEVSSAIMPGCGLGKQFCS